MTRVAMVWSRRWSSGWAGAQPRCKRGPFIVERVDAIDEEHVQVDVEVQRRAESLDEGDGSGAGTGAHAQSGVADEEGGDRPVDDAQDLGEHRGAGREQKP